MSPRIDLDELNADQTLQLWERRVRIKRTREADPTLREDILRLLPRLSPALSDAIRQQLDEVHPAAVLMAHRRELVDAGLDHVAATRPRAEARCTESTRRRPVDATPVAWLASHPNFLGRYVDELQDLQLPRRQIVESAFAFAEEAGHATATSQPIIVAALRRPSSHEERYAA